VLEAAAQGNHRIDGHAGLILLLSNVGALGQGWPQVFLISGPSSSWRCFSMML
jgi:hypothetical protein